MVEYGSKYVYRYDSMSGSDVAIFPSRKLDRGLRVRYEVFINKADISAEMLWDVVRGRKRNTRVYNVCMVPYTILTPYQAICIFLLENIKGGRGVAKTNHGESLWSGQGG